MKLLIGLVGEKGGGKETFTDILRGVALPHAIAHVRSSDILNETLRQWDLPATRTNLQHLAIVMDEGFGKGTLTHAVAERLKKLSEEIVIIDGVRWFTDEEMVRSFSANLLVYVTAPLDTRFDRVRARKERSGEATTNKDQFLEEEKVSTELNISEIGSRADAVIANEGSLEEFRAKIEALFEEKIGPHLQ